MNRRLLEMIEELPPEVQRQVEDFVEFLRSRVGLPRQRPKFPWAGALADLKDRYTSVELQHRITDWRRDER